MITSWRTLQRAAARFSRQLKHEAVALNESPLRFTH